MMIVYLMILYFMPKNGCCNLKVWNHVCAGLGSGGALGFLVVIFQSRTGQAFCRDVFSGFAWPAWILIARGPQRWLL